MYKCKIRKSGLKRIGMTVVVTSCLSVRAFLVKGALARILVLGPKIMLADSALSLFPIIYFLNLLSSGIEADKFSCPSVKIR